MCDAVKRAEEGPIDADLGGEVIKQRLARLGEGRRGGYRVMIAHCDSERAVFLYGFAKNGSDNIDDDELKTLQEIAACRLDAGAVKLKREIEEGALCEVSCDEC